MEAYVGITKCSNKTTNHPKISAPMFSSSSSEWTRWVFGLMSKTLPSCLTLPIFVSLFHYRFSKKFCHFSRYVLAKDNRFTMPFLYRCEVLWAACANNFASLDYLLGSILDVFVYSDWLILDAIGRELEYIFFIILIVSAT